MSTLSQFPPYFQTSASASPVSLLGTIQTIPTKLIDPITMMVPAGQLLSKAEYPQLASKFTSGLYNNKLSIGVLNTTDRLLDVWYCDSSTMLVRMMVPGFTQVWRASMDKGITWNDILLNGLAASQNLSHMVRIGTTLYAMFYNAGMQVIKSVDNGVNWSVCITIPSSGHGIGITFKGSLICALVTPNVSGFCLAATSADNGVTWSYGTTGISWASSTDNVSIWAMASNAPGVTAPPCLMLHIPNRGVLCSSNGLSWSVNAITIVNTMNGSLISSRSYACAWDGVNFKITSARSGPNTVGEYLGTWVSSTGTGSWTLQGTPYAMSPNMNSTIFVTYLPSVNKYVMSESKADNAAILNYQLSDDGLVWVQYFPQMVNPSINICNITNHNGSDFYGTIYCINFPNVGKFVDYFALPNTKYGDVTMAANMNSHEMVIVK